MTNSSSVSISSYRRLSLSGENSPSSSTFYEVLYVGKIRISSKRTLKTFIDDSVNRFKCQEADRLHRLQESSFNKNKENDRPKEGESLSQNRSVNQSNTDEAGLAHPLMPLPDEPKISSPVSKSQSSGHVKDDVKAVFSEKRLFEESVTDSCPERVDTFRVRAASMSALQKNRMNPPNHKEPMGNKTMLMQIGRSDIRLIYPDRRQILFNKCLKDVIHCEEGVHFAEHFGFICRDHSSGGSIGYVFKCESTSVVNDIMICLRTAHQYAQERMATRENPRSCSSCPMYMYQQLVRDMENAANTRLAHSILLKRLERLPEEEKNSIMDKLKGAVTSDIEKRTEIIMVLLKANYEIKQKSHKHCLDDASDHKSLFLNEVGGSILRAKRSLTNSFSDMMKRKASIDASFNTSHLLHEHSTSPIVESVEESPMRRRSQTLGSAPRESVQRELGSKIALFMRSSNQAASPSAPCSNILKAPDCSGSPSKSISGTPRVRRDIFKRVITPAKPKESSSSAPSEKRDYKLLWKRVIKQQILLVRMERENKKIIESQFEAEERRLKLDYAQILSPVDEWIDFNSDYNLHSLEIKMQKGIPKAKRGDVWKYLSENSKVSDCFPQDLPDIPYSELKQNLTPHQHAIIIDLGRTFPGHPYFSGSLGPGQLALYNVLKAYSLMDVEVGYCQGLAFVAGVFLMHTNTEEEAFHLLKHLMFGLGFRKQYQSDMIGLQIQMYQLSRLLHDVQKEIFDHIEEIGIDPSLYATSWFLTVFASNFPLGFVVRVFDLIFLEGLEGLFKVALSLISTSKDSILECRSLDDLMVFMKSDIPEMDSSKLNHVIDEAFSLSFSKQLSSYEIEYHVLQEELMAQSTSSASDLDWESLRSENEVLKKRLALLEDIASTQNVLKDLPLNQETFTRDELVSILDKALYFNFENDMKS